MTIETLPGHRESAHTASDTPETAGVLHHREKLRRSDWRAYARLVQRIADGETLPKRDSEKLAGLLRTLGIADDDFRLDTSKLRALKATEERAAAELPDAEKYAKIQAELDQARRDHEEAIRSWPERETSFRRRLLPRDRHRDETRLAKSRLRELRADARLRALESLLSDSDSEPEKKRDDTAKPAEERPAT